MSNLTKYCVEFTTHSQQFDRNYSDCSFFYAENELHAVNQLLDELNEAMRDDESLYYIDAITVSMTQPQPH